MKYLCLIYGEEAKFEAMDETHCAEVSDDLRRSGQCIAAERLQPVQTATTLRVRDGRVAVTDGPFAETKEQLAGFYLIEAGNLDEAIEIASRIPPAKVGSIEVRPVRQLTGASQ